jgi:hypothetical protein
LNLSIGDMRAAEALCMRLISQLGQLRLKGGEYDCASQVFDRLTPIAIEIGTVVIALARSILMRKLGLVAAAWEACVKG